LSGGLFGSIYMERKKAVSKKVAHWLQKKYGRKVMPLEDGFVGFWETLLRLGHEQEEVREDLLNGFNVELSSCSLESNEDKKEGFIGNQGFSQFSRDDERAEPPEYIELKKNRSFSQKLGKRVISYRPELPTEYEADLNSTKAVLGDTAGDYKFIERKKQAGKKMAIKSFASKRNLQYDFNLKRDLSIGVKKLEPIQKNAQFSIVNDFAIDKLRASIDEYTQIKRRSIEDEQNTQNEHELSGYPKKLKTQVKPNYQNYQIKTFTSARTKLALPCFRDSQIHSYKQNNLVNLMHEKSFRDEDCDSTESEIRNAIRRQHDNIRDWLMEDKLKKERFKMPNSKPRPSTEEESQKIEKQLCISDDPPPKTDEYEGYNTISIGDGWVQLIPKANDADEESIRPEIVSRSIKTLGYDYSESEKCESDAQHSTRNIHESRDDQCYSNQVCSIKSLTTNKQ
jgi:hypothetical protein